MDQLAIGGLHGSHLWLSRSLRVPPSAAATPTLKKVFLLLKELVSLNSTVTVFALSPLYLNYSSGKVHPFRYLAPTLSL